MSRLRFLLPPAAAIPRFFIRAMSCFSRRAMLVCVEEAETQGSLRHFFSFLGRVRSMYVPPFLANWHFELNKKTKSCILQTIDDKLTLYMSIYHQSFVRYKT